jgi:cytidyltransferase-like protein
MTERVWGNYKVVSKTKILEILPGEKTSRQYHLFRDENWHVLSGSGWLEIDGERHTAAPGEFFYVPAKQVHQIEAGGQGLCLLEVSSGLVDENDIVRLSGSINTIVASGYFDPLHCGHIDYLQAAKALGGRLVVIVNNDYQTRMKKQKEFMCEAERMKIIRAISCVDEVFLSVDIDASVCRSLEKIHEISPVTVFAKGGDRNRNEIPEAKTCDRLGIKIIDRLGEKVQSSSALIARCKDGEG